MKYQLIIITPVLEKVILLNTESSKFVVLAYRKGLYEKNIKWLMTDPTLLQWLYCDTKMLKKFIVSIPAEFDTLDEVREHLKEYLWVYAV